MIDKGYEDADSIAIDSATENEPFGDVNENRGVICQQCAGEGKRSVVYVGGSFTTAMGGDRFYDENGSFHIHDPNITSTSYRCSNCLSEWSIKSKKQCPSCPKGDGVTHGDWRDLG